ncbi:MAG: helix-hairpin-helix domain-containing protein [Deltaproteobacteria bacterium]|nr:helix-hairpin-helix domain-containing protein [Deltaproteobacteria bacterium]MBW2218229.1 helix-hairpin-helix domain-containing protein [Deltaproteobacteria bacterium]
MNNHLFIRLSSICIAIAILALIPTILPAQETTASDQAGTSQININTASESQLTELPGIGPAIAERIVRHRQKVGPFKAVEDLKQVKGIGDKIFIKIKNLIVTEHTS